MSIAFHLLCLSFYLVSLHAMPRLKGASTSRRNEEASKVVATNKDAPRDKYGLTEEDHTRDEEHIVKMVEKKLARINEQGTRR